VTQRAEQRGTRRELGNVREAGTEAAVANVVEG
jgi:hypothetical protein